MQIGQQFLKVNYQRPGVTHGNCERLEAETNIESRNSSRIAVAVAEIVAAGAVVVVLVAAIDVLLFNCHSIVLM